MGELRWTIQSVNDGNYQLDHDPQGWEELVLKLVRDEFYHGVFYEFTGGGSEVVPIGFYCKGGGKEFIDSLYDKYGQEADAYMNIEYRCQDGAFEQLYYGKLNFASYDEQSRNNVLYSYLNIEQYGITQKVRNREDVPVNLRDTVSLNGLALSSSYEYDLNLHSKAITLIASAENTGGDSKEVDVHNSSAFNIFHQPTINSLENELKQTSNISPVWDFPSPTLSTFTALPFHNTEGATPNIWPTDYNYNIVCNGNLVVTPTDPATSHTLISINLILRKGSDLATSTIVDSNSTTGFTSQNGTQTVNFTNSLSGTVTVNYGEKLWLVWNIFQYTVLTTAFFPTIVNFEFNYSAFTIDLDTDSVFPDSTCKALCIHEAWSRLSEIITDQTLAFKSEYYGRTNSQPIQYSSNGCNSFAAITSGKNIRAFPNEPITVSLRDFFKGCTGIDNIGLGIEDGNIIRVENKKYFYDDIIIFQQGYVPNIDRKFSDDFIFNTLEFGYGKWEIDAVNGLNEPNSKRKYSIPDIKTIKNNLDFVSTFVTGMYPIENTRRFDVINFPTTDNNYDYDIFIIALNRSVDGDNRPNNLTIAEKDENFDTVTNILEPSTSYNLRYSPTMNLLRWFPVYSIGMNKVLNYQNYWIMILTDYEGNIDMETTLSTYYGTKCPGEFGYQNAGYFIGLALPEQWQYISPTGTGIVNGIPVPLAPYSISELYGEPLFMPEEISFEFPVSYSEFKTIKTNPKGLVKIASDGINFMTGYIKTFEFDLRRKIGSFVLYRKS